MNIKGREERDLPWGGKLVFIELIGCWIRHTLCVWFNNQVTYTLTGNGKMRFYKEVF